MQTPICTINICWKQIYSQGAFIVIHAALETDHSYINPETEKNIFLFFEILPNVELQSPVLRIHILQVIFMS